MKRTEHVLDSWWSIMRIFIIKIRTPYKGSPAFLMAKQRNIQWHFLSEMEIPSNLLGEKKNDIGVFVISSSQGIDAVALCFVVTLGTVSGVFYSFLPSFSYQEGQVATPTTRTWWHRWWHSPRPFRALSWAGKSFCLWWLCKTTTKAITGC